MRLSIAEPLPERRWFRRGWVTFDRDVVIKEVCWNLNTVRVSLKLKLLCFNIYYKCIFTLLNCICIIIMNYNLKFKYDH